ncbi:hypothetical protein [Herpetosiphon giganteus]|uniref:hypothetical protein n=1 Tax=Herpetosiphon giganteus TaxID=2029754 RepID=UPI00195D037B|nr:hypothetical protein [Herpetosiphon giganteus]MBM7846587.1 hypothetical protein [Herpetosiphon giganteus]
MRMTMDTALDYLVGQLSKQTPPEFFAEILDDLLWLIDDPEMELQRIARGWLIADDMKKVQVALSIRGMALLESDAERHAIFEKIIGRWPDLEPICRTSLQL